MCDKVQDNPANDPTVRYFCNKATVVVRFHDSRISLFAILFKDVVDVGGCGGGHGVEKVCECDCVV